LFDAASLHNANYFQLVGQDVQADKMQKKVCRIGKIYNILNKRFEKTVD